jgi:hypothetical protein
MTKQERKELSKAIKGLPEVTDPNNMVHHFMEGSALIASGTYKTKTGEPVVRSKTYSFKEPAVINHRTEAEKAFIIGGMTAVHLYCNEVLKNTLSALRDGIEVAPEIKEDEKSI